VKAFSIYGGVETEPQSKQIEQGLDIVIATPGRMFEFIRKSELDLSQVQTLVLDEADRMLDLGFIDDIEMVKRFLPRYHQTLFFSATINPKIKKLAYSQIKSNALRIQISPEQRVSKNVTHFLVQVPMEDKRALLANFVAHHPESKMIVFVRTQVRAERIQAFLEKVQISSVHFHGGLDQTQRDQSLQRFRDGEIKLLVATDVSARGIDLPGIEYVINFDLPDDPENYVHRVGRTGRGFAKGEAISFCSAEEKEKLQAIEEFLGNEITRLKVSPQDLEMKKVEKEPETIQGMLRMLEDEFARPTKRKKKPKKS
jgi:ATP-dependent RNA helicase RhlE